MKSLRCFACVGPVLVSALLAGCSGGSTPATLRNGAAPTPTPSGTATPIGSGTAAPAPTATPAPGVLAAAPDALAFDSTAAGAAQSVSAIEHGYSGTFAATIGTCTNVVSVSAPSANGTFTVTPLAQGSCSFAITDSKHQSIDVAVTVTLTTATAQFHGPGGRK